MIPIEGTPGGGRGVRVNSGRGVSAVSGSSVAVAPPSPTPERQNRAFWGPRSRRLLGQNQDPSRPFPALLPPQHAKSERAGDPGQSAREPAVAQDDNFLGLGVFGTAANFLRVSVALWWVFPEIAFCVIK